MKQAKIDELANSNLGIEFIMNTLLSNIITNKNEKAVLKKALFNLLENYDYQFKENQIFDSSFFDVCRNICEDKKAIFETKEKNICKNFIIENIKFISDTFEKKNEKIKNDKKEEQL